MRKRISSGMTFFYKYIIQIIWGFLFMPYLFLDLVKDTDLNHLVAADIGIFLVIAGFIVILIYFFFKILKIEIDVPDKLIASNYRKTVEIPIQDIKKISQSYFLIPVVVWITLNKPSEFGDKIAFIPKRELGAVIFGHSVVGELSELAALARNDHESKTTGVRS